MKEWENPQLTHINRLPPRAHFIYYQDAITAISQEREHSPYFMQLSGEWKFKLFDYPEDTPAHLCGQDTTLWDDITVPSCWQLYTERGYDIPQYMNIDYAFANVPPYVPAKNPTGVYIREFHLNADFVKEGVTINFEGVCSCMYLFVNDFFVGMSKGSHIPAEFDISSVVREGKNTIAVKVQKWCDGSYLEAQDMFKLSGIFREVYLLAKTHSHIRDVQIIAQPDHSFQNGQVEAIFDLEGPILGNISVCILKDGKRLLEDTVTPTLDKAAFYAPLQNISLWWEDDPSRYTLIATYQGRAIIQHFGFQKTQIVGDVFMVNGRPVKIKGVNRHDIHPERGYAVSFEDMEKDVLLMKQFGCNAVRTSHYPNHPYFLDLCDRYGLYVIDEADLETHGMQWEGRWDELSCDPLWEKAYVDRALRMVHRDKNHPCIVMWSLGNESGSGENHNSMTKAIKSVLPGAIIHYEGATRHSVYVEGPERITQDNPNKAPWVDVVSNMYPSIALLKEIGEKNNEPRPFFMCEFAYAQANGCGSLKEYMEAVYAYPHLMGGCIWEFCDHGLAHTDASGKRFLAYGGDFGETHHDGNVCMNGMVSAYREPYSSLYEFKQAMAPVKVTLTDAKDGTISLENRYDSLSLSHLRLVFTVKEKDRELMQGVVENLTALAGQSETISLGLSLPEYANYKRVLDIEFVLKEDALWAGAGHPICFAQVILPCIIEAVQTTSSAAPNVREEEHQLFVCGQDFEHSFDLRAGQLTQATFAGQPMFAAAPRWTVWRSPMDNDNRMKIQWEEHWFCRPLREATSCKWEMVEDKVVFTVTEYLSKASHRPFITITTQYTVDGKGRIEMDAVGDYHLDKIRLPRFAMQFVLREGYDKIQWYGLGPLENYPDKKLSAKYGFYEKNIRDLYVAYSRPQESGNRGGVTFARLQAPSFGNIIFSSEQELEMCALKYLPCDLEGARHHKDMPSERENAILYLGLITGVGSNAVGFPPLDEYCLLRGQHHVKFAIEVEKSN